MQKNTLEEYKKFMYNKNNILKCEHCPENREIKSSDNELKLPCGHYNCWVKLHN